jgi:hypothetical protein
MKSQNEDDGRNPDIVQDGEAVSVSFFMRDGGGWNAAMDASDRLRDLDTGAVDPLDSAHIAAIRLEAAREGLPVATYLRDRLHYTIERDGK